MSHTHKRTHQSTQSNGSTYPLPSLCSSLSSHNSSSKSLPLSKQQDKSNDGADNENVLEEEAKVSRQSAVNDKHRRWDDSQFAIDLCDKSLRRGQEKSTHSNSASFKNRILKSKLFQYQQQQQQQHNTRHHDEDDHTPSHHSNHSQSSSSHGSSHSQISVKFTSLLRKIKSMKSL